MNWPWRKNSVAAWEFLSRSKVSGCHLSEGVVLVISLSERKPSSSLAVDKRTKELSCEEALLNEKPRRSN